MATEFLDSAHWGFFMTGTTLTSATGKYIRVSELALAALRAQGVFDNLIDGTVPPETDKLWLDKNTDPAVLKEWDPTGSSWAPMTFERLFGRAIVTPMAAPTGTPNALVVAAPTPFIQKRMYSLTPIADNTAAATLQVTGVGTYPVKYTDGADIEAQELKAGNPTILLFTGVRFEVLFKVADIYDAADRAEAAAANAEAYANSQLTFNTKALAAAATIPGAVDAVRLHGSASIGDGLGGVYIDTDNGNADTFTSSGGTARTWYRAPQRFVMPASQAALLPAPATIENWDHRWSIFRFAGGVEERAKPTATADYQAVMNGAFATGEKVELPKWELPVRSLSGTHGIETAGVDIDVECAAGATIIAGDVFWNAAHNVLQFVGDTPLAAENLGGAATFKWKGGVLSGRQLTTDHGTGAGFGNGMLNVVGFFMPEVEGVFFDGGIVAPSFNLIGAGAIDTLLGWNQNVGGVVKSCSFLGAYDVGIYGNGYRIVSTLGNNPITSGSVGSAVATVSATAHGMRNGDRCHLKGVTTFDGLTFADGEYAVSGVSTNAFQVTATSGTATVGAVAGGGAAVVFTNSRTNKRATTILGESTLFTNLWFSRCTNAIGIKRNMRNLKIAFSTFRDNANGVGTSGVGEYEGGDGKRLHLIGNDYFNTMNWPIRLQGGGPETIVEGETIENWGRQLYDGGATAINLSSGFPLSAIHLDSMDGAQVRGCVIRMTDNFAGASWIAGEEPAALRLSNNADYLGGCVDTLLERNTIIDVPKLYHIESTSLRTRIRPGKERGATIAPLLAGTATVLEVTNSYSSGTIGLDTTGVKTISIAHGLPFTPTVAICHATLGSTTTNSFDLGWIRVVSTDATNVNLACKVNTAAAGQTITLNLLINNANP